MSWLLNLLFPADSGPLMMMGGTPRSTHWPRVRAEFLQDNPKCAVCGTKDNVEVHHVQPYHLHPALELNKANLVTLCRPHHLLVGHLMDWQSYNPACWSDVALWSSKINRRPA